MGHNLLCCTDFCLYFLTEVIYLKKMLFLAHWLRCSVLGTFKPSLWLTLAIFSFSYVVCVYAWVCVTIETVKRQAPTHREPMDSHSKVSGYSPVTPRQPTLSARLREELLCASAVLVTRLRRTAAQCWVAVVKYSLSLFFLRRRSSFNFKFLFRSF